MYAKNHDGGFIRIKTLVDNTIIYETNNDIAFLSWEERFSLVPSLWRIEYITISEKGNYKLRVTKNTIIQKFEVH